MSDYSLLLVENDEETVDRLTRWLIQRGYDVIPARHPRQALSAASRTRFDVLVIDATLPETSGIDLMDQLRKFCDVPVIMLTGRDDQAVQHEAVERGVYRNVFKPVDGARLETIVSEALTANKTSRHAIEVSSTAESFL